MTIKVWKQVDTSVTSVYLGSVHFAGVSAVEAVKQSLGTHLFMKPGTYIVQSGGTAIPNMWIFEIEEVRPPVQLRIVNI